MFVDMEALPVSNDTTVANEKEYQEDSGGTHQEQPGAKSPEQKDGVKS